MTNSSSLSKGLSSLLMFFQFEHLPRHQSEAGNVWGSVEQKCSSCKRVEPRSQDKRVIHEVFVESSHDSSDSSTIFPQRVTRDTYWGVSSRSSHKERYNQSNDFIYFGRDFCSRRLDILNRGKASACLYLRSLDGSILLQIC